MQEDEIFSVLRSWNKCNLEVLRGYRFYVEDTYRLLNQTQIRYHERNCKNAVNVFVLPSENFKNARTKAADILVTVQEIKEEKAWEEKTGCRSILRYAFHFDAF